MFFRLAIVTVSVWNVLQKLQTVNDTFKHNVNFIPRNLPNTTF